MRITTYKSTLLIEPTNFTQNLVYVTHATDIKSDLSELLRGRIYNLAPNLVQNFIEIVQGNYEHVL